VLQGGRIGEDEWFLAAWFRLSRRATVRPARARIKELPARRIASQPLAAECRQRVPQPAR
jgi:hypothetical protein